MTRTVATRKMSTIGQSLLCLRNEPARLINRSTSFGFRLILHENANLSPENPPVPILKTPIMFYHHLHSLIVNDINQSVLSIHLSSIPPKKSALQPAFQSNFPITPSCESDRRKFPPSFLKGTLTTPETCQLRNMLSAAKMYEGNEFSGKVGIGKVGGRKE